MATSFMRYLDINVQLTPSTTASTTSKTCLLIGQRIVTGGTFRPAAAGYPQPNYYVPFLLPTFTDGWGALAYLANFGFKYQRGISFTMTLTVPTSVIIGNGTTTLAWTSEPNPNFSSLINFNLSGNLTQTTPSTVTAPVRSATVITTPSVSYQLVVNGNVSFSTTGGVLTLAGLNNINYPDPNATDPICLMVWDFYQTALSAFVSALGRPQCYISVLSDRDSTVSPNGTALVLTDPTAVAGAGATQTLTFLASSANIGYLPTTALGNTSVTQATSLATGAFGGYVVSGSNIIMTVTNCTGTFDATNVVSVTLDSTRNCFNYLDNIQLYGAVQQFPITTHTDITTKYADFFDGITLLNQANQVLLQHFLIYGCAGNISSLPPFAATLPVANSQYNIFSTYPYVAMFGDVPYENTAGNVAGGRIMSAVLYMLANGDAPFPPLMTAIINHLPVSSVSSTTSYSGLQGGTGDIAVEQGWLPLAPNSQGLVQLLESNTTLITEPSTTTPDVEFRYTHIWDCVRWLKQQTTNLFTTISVLPNNQGSVLISPQFITQFRNGIISILFQGQALNVVENVDLYQGLVTVTQDTQDPNQVDAYIPAQIIPQLNGASVLINVFSSLTTNFNR